MVDAPSTLALLVRLAFSLTVVIGLLLLAAKVARKNGRSLRIPGLGGIGGRDEPTLKVIERHSLSRTTSLAVVQVGGRTMVVGVTEHEISLLTDQVDTDDPAAPAVPQPDRSVTDLVDEEPSGSVTSISAVREAKGTLPLAPGSVALDAAVNPERPPRMSFVDALREMTVRSA